MQQGTQAWLELRKTKITATDASTIMLVNPYKSPMDVYEEKVLGKLTPVNKYMQRGLDLEPIARSYFEMETGFEVFPEVVIGKQNTWTMASMDGLSENKQIALEIKCPGYVDHSTALQGKIPDKYFPQLQHQMMVCELDRMFYLSFDGFSGKIIELKRDDSYIKGMLTEEEEFYFYIKNQIPPPPKEKDYQKREDEEWKKNVIEHIEDTNELKKLEDKMEKRKQWFISQAGDSNVMGAGLKLYKYSRQGNIDYKSIPQLKEVDLEPYRKKNSIVWTVKI